MKYYIFYEEGYTEWSIINVITNVVKAKSYNEACEFIFFLDDDKSLTIDEIKKLDYEEKPYNNPIILSNNVYL